MSVVVVVVCISSHNWSARQRHHCLQSVFRQATMSVTQQTSSHWHIQKPLRESQENRTHMAEDHWLADGYWAVDVWQCGEFVFEAAALDVVLLYIVETLLFSSQLDDDGVMYDAFSKSHHLIVVCGGEQQQLAVWPQTSGKQTATRLVVVQTQQTYTACIIICFLITAHRLQLLLFMLFLSQYILWLVNIYRGDRVPLSSDKNLQRQSPQFLLAPVTIFYVYDGWLVAWQPAA